MKKYVNKEEIVTYGENTVKLLQNIIDGISGNPTQSTTYSIDFSKLKKLKISIKIESGQPYTKCKIKYEDRQDVPMEQTGAPDTSNDKPEYKVLKKRIEKTFKAIGDRLKNSSFPSNLETELFCRNAELMTTYPGFGDKMYPAFLQLVSEFEEAFHQEDIQKCLAKYDEIKAMKRACHSED